MLPSSTTVLTFGVASSRQVGGGETADEMIPVLRRREQHRLF